MNSPIQSLDQLYAEMNQKHATQTSAEFISFQPQEQQMDPFSPSEPLVAPVAPAKQMEAPASTSNPFRSMPAPIQPSLPTPSSPQVQHGDNKNDAAPLIGQMHMYFDRMTKMMMTMDDRLTRLESLMSHNLYILHQQQQSQQQQQVQVAKNKDTQEEDLESALKEQVKAELAQLKRMQAQYEKDSEIAKKIQAQMDDEYFVEERKKFYQQPPPTVTSYQPPKPRVPGYEECPICQMQFKQSELEAHVYACLDGDKNIAADGTKKVVDKPGFLARLFGAKTTPEEKVPLTSSPAQQPHHTPVEYPGQPGGIYPGVAAYPPMYSPYMGTAMPAPPMYYYMPPPPHNPSQ